MKQKSQLMVVFSSLLILTACGGGGGTGTPVDVNTPADFVMEVPIDTTEYVNADDTNDMATFNPLSVKMAYANTILQMPPLTSNLLQTWYEGDCATLYDEADPANIRLLPLIGEWKKLAVGEQYQLIVEANRLDQHNPCGHGYAVTGEWTFSVVNVRAEFGRIHSGWFRRRY